MNKHDLADQFIREVYQQYPNIRHGQNTAPALALIRACEKIEELEGRLAISEGANALSPATMRQDGAGTSMKVGDTRAPDPLVSPQDDPVLPAAQGELGQIRCPNCDYPVEPRYKDNGVVPVVIYYCGRCGYLEHR